MRFCSFLALTLGIVLFTSVIVGSAGCEGNAFPEDSFIINKPFLAFFQSCERIDTFMFQNDESRIDTFVITKIDSLLLNSKGYFINRKPMKLLFMKYKQIPVNYWNVSRTEYGPGNNEKKQISENGTLISITRYPTDGITELTINFKRFYAVIKNDFGEPVRDTLKIKSSNFNNYYKIPNETSQLLKDSNDVKVIYITIKEGIIAYQDLSGKWWIKRPLK